MTVKQTISNTYLIKTHYNYTYIYIKMKAI